MTKAKGPLLGDPLLVNVNEGCRQLGVGRTKFYEILPDLKSIVIGRKRLIFLNSKRDYAAELATEGEAMMCPHPFPDVQRSGCAFLLGARTRMQNRLPWPT